jgi:hypothetical protein
MLVSTRWKNPAPPVTTPWSSPLPSLMPPRPCTWRHRWWLVGCIHPRLHRWMQRARVWLSEPASRDSNMLVWLHAWGCGTRLARYSKHLGPDSADMRDLGISLEPGSLQPGLVSQAHGRNEPIRPMLCPPRSRYCYPKMWERPKKYLKKQIQSVPRGRIHGNKRQQCGGASIAVIGSGVRVW